MIQKIHTSWSFIYNELHREPLLSFKESMLSNISYQPSKEKVFRVFEKPMEDIKIVILGQDPFPNPGESSGYSFIKENGFPKAMSTINIEKEVGASDSNNINDSGVIDLKLWIDQGVFFLNTALTVETAMSGSHLTYWQSFTERVIQVISSKQPCIWLLWGDRVRSYKNYIANPYFVDLYDESTIMEIPIYSDKNYILTTEYPSFDKFMGCNHFKYANVLLEKKNGIKIKW
jgi:uracil-DNA glycosylase